MASRPRTEQRLALILGALCILFGAYNSQMHAQTARTANDRIYSDAQAKRGEALYKSRCVSCHGEALRGDSGPPLTGDAFLAAWGGQPLSELADKILHPRPADDPGKLSRQQSADVVAHILQVGKFPAGQADLSVEEAQLKTMTMAAASAPKPVAPQASH